MIETAILRSVAQVSPFPMFAVSAGGLFLYANKAFERLAARTITSGDHGSSVFQSTSATSPGWVPANGFGEESLDEDTLRNGARMMTLRYCTALPDGTAAVVGVVLSVIDPGTGMTLLDEKGSALSNPRFARFVHIGERQKAELMDRLRLAEVLREEAVEAAQRDPATGLRNRVGLDIDLEAAISERSRNEGNLFLLFLDLDHFKHINDSFGHRTGDRVLRAVARRFRAIGGIRSAARIGGDEFAILVDHGASDPGELMEQIVRLMPRMFRAVRIDRRTIPVSGSVGVSVYGVDAYDSETMKLHADTALIEAKRLGKDRVKIFDRDLARRSNRRRILERDLRRAVAGQELVPEFQPIVPLRAGERCGVEVLARWRHPVLGTIGPEEFVSIASDSGFISELDFSVMRTACALARDWIRSGDLAFLSFNISPLEIARPGHAEMFLRTLSEYGIPPRKACVEIVETGIIRDLKRATTALNRLKSAGVSIALDDYGTGYSNLRALLDLPIDKIKIDRSLIAHVAEDERAMRLVLSLVQLARVFNAELVAEGVEDEAQAAVIRSMGCHYAQGFKLCPPLSPAELNNWLASARSRAA